MSRISIHRITIFLMLVCLCAGCGGQDTQVQKETAVYPEMVREEAAEQEKSDVADAKQAAEPDMNPAQTAPENEKLMCLPDADMETLFGLSFGDRIDYARFEVCGIWGRGPVFREINGKDYIYFYFHGENHGFSGFGVSHEELGFLGLDWPEEKLDRLIGLYGEPDELENDASTGTARWNFDRASLEVDISNGYISGVEYLAAEGAADGEEIPWDQTDLAKDFQGNYDYAENIYRWEATHGSYAGETEASYHPYDDDYDADRVDEFIMEYWEKEGIRKTEPDGTVYNRRGEPLVEYYIDEAAGQYCFVVHLWGGYWTDYEAGLSEYQDAVYCTTHVVTDSDRIGTLLYNIDEARKVARERLYDTEGMRKADISYADEMGDPITMIEDFWYLETGYDADLDVLCRGRKFWFDEGQSEFDESGRFIRYHGLDASDSGTTHEGLDRAGYYTYPCTCFYNGQGRLEKIEEDLLSDDEEREMQNSGQVEFQYDVNGIVKEAVYQRSSWTQGTTDSIGEIEYDEKGRMIYNRYYITHGRHTEIFVYEEGANRPWACFRWCSFAPGFVDVYLFETVL